MVITITDADNSETVSISLLQESNSQICNNRRSADRTRPLTPLFANVTDALCSLVDGLTKTPLYISSGSQGFLNPPKRS
jgi:hypothetical protein